MSSVATLPSTDNPQQATPRTGVCVMTGRIRAVKRIPPTDDRPEFFVTWLVAPADDAYSKPSNFELISARRLGQIDSDWQGRVKLSGYRRSYTYTDKKTGELLAGVEFKTMLRVVE